MVGISEAGLKCQMHEKPKEKENFKVCSLKKKKRKLQLQAKIPSVIVFFFNPDHRQLPVRSHGGKTVLSTQTWFTDITLQCVLRI